MKVAYLSVYRDGTGYSHAAISNILALHVAGLDVVTRPIRMSNGSGEIPSLIAELERKDLGGVDVVIQHCLPHTFEYKRGVKNVGVFSWETSHFRNSTWAEHCNMMDEIWMSSLQSRQAALDSGVEIPIKLVPHSCEPRLYVRQAPLEIEGVADKFVFYTIGEMTRRKNFAGLIRSYYATFTERDDVLLVIKTSAPGMSAEDAERSAVSMINDIRGATHINKVEGRHPPIVIITGYWSEAAMARLHSTGDAFVLPSRGESWCMPAMDALGFGNPVMASNWGSFPDLLYEQARDYFQAPRGTFIHPGEIRTGWFIPGVLTPCFGQTGFNDLYCGNEFWFDADLHALSIQMRMTYEAGKGGLTNKRAAAQERVKLLSHEVVGHYIRTRVLGD